MSGLLDGWDRVSLLHPWFLAAGLAIPLALLARRAAGRPALLLAPLGAFAGPAAAPLPRTLRERLTALPAWFRALGLVLLVVALARPVEKVPLPVRVEGIDLVLCLDVSSSMRTEDPGAGGARLDAAKEAAARFIDGRPADRIGLVTFARYPDVRCPPTGDHRALLAILDGVAPVEEDGPEDATGIGAAAARAAEVLRAGGGASRVAVLLTDGEENVAPSGAPGAIPPAHAALLAAELGVRIHAIRAGAGAPSPEVRSVRDMASRTGGRFYEARDPGALAAVYADIDALERSAAERERFDLRERFPSVLAAGLVLLLLGRLLGASVPAVLP